MAARQAYINSVALTIESEMPIYENLSDNILQLTRVERDAWSKTCLQFLDGSEESIKNMLRFFLVTPFNFD